MPLGKREGVTLPDLRIVTAVEPAFAVRQEGIVVARFDDEPDARNLAARLSWEGPVEVVHNGVVVWSNVEDSWARIRRRLRDLFASRHGAWTTHYELMQDGIVVMTAMHPRDAFEQASILAVDGGPIEIFEVRRRVLHSAG